MRRADAVEQPACQRRRLRWEESHVSRRGIHCERSVVRPGVRCMAPGRPPRRRPPDEVHGPFKTDIGCVVLEVSFPQRTSRDEKARKQSAAIPPRRGGTLPQLIGGRLVRRRIALYTTSAGGVRRPKAPGIVNGLYVVPGAQKLPGPPGHFLSCGAGVREADRYLDEVADGG
jgi:hypothetical protein